MAELSLKLGSSIELTVESLDPISGEGVASLDGLRVNIPCTAPGDTVRGTVISVRPTHARALLEEVLHKGNRVQPRCPLFGRCGGCDYQHLDYQAQLAQKTATVRHALSQKCPDQPLSIQPTLATRPWRYRNKFQAPVATHHGKLTIGLYQAHSHNLVPVTDCPIQHKATNRFATMAAGVAQRLGVPPYDETRHQGILRHLVTRHGEATGETMLTVVVSTLKWPGSHRFLDALRGELMAAGCTTIVLNENPEATNVILGQSREEVVAGPGYIRDRLGSLKLHISPRSFWQVNHQGTLALYDQIKRYASLTGTETVWDIYCGIGSIGLYLAAGGAREVVGVEKNPEAVADATGNTRRNRLSNATFHKLDVEQDLGAFMAAHPASPQVVVLDPPRKGCSVALLQAVAQRTPRRVIYVSCNPTSLARDLQLLHGLGYHLVDAQPVDMFPQTRHVEVVCLLMGPEFRH